METLTDEALVSLGQTGSSDAIETLIARYLRFVKSLARPLFLIGGDAEDLTQEGMLGLLSAIRTYSPDGGASFHTYAETCIRRRLLNAIESAARFKHRPLNHALSLDHLQDGAQEQQAMFTARELEDALLAKEQISETFRQFSVVLSPFEHEVLRLFLEGFRYREIALRVKKTEKSVDNAIGRIRKKLAQHYKNGENSSG